MQKPEAADQPARAWVVRKHIRFKPGHDCFASIDLIADRKVFSPSIIALVLDESYSGCGLVSLATPKLQEGDLCRVQVGRLTPILAKVRWRRRLDDHVLRIGLTYLE